MYFILPIFLLFILLCTVLFIIRKEQITAQLATHSMFEKAQLLNTLIRPYQLAYNLYKDTFSRTDILPEIPPPSTADYETIPFVYDGRNWLLTLSKGQYGLSTGAMLWFSCVDHDVPKEDIPLFSYTLYKGIASIGHIKSVQNQHLATFSLGQYTEPELLRMEVTVAFKNRDMIDAFMAGLKEAGYTDSQFELYHSSISFTFYTPKSIQIRAQHPVSAKYACYKSRFILSLYHFTSYPYCYCVDRLLLLYYMFPACLTHLLPFVTKS